MKPAPSGRQRGVVLLAMVAVLALGASWYLVSRLNSESGLVTAVKRARNAQILNKAKLALIGYVAQKASTSGENNPGRLPCPEAVNNIGTSSEGISAPWIGPPTTTTCSSIGRLPWRTIGMDKLIDSANEPLWYVVGPTWRLTNSSSTLLINSNTAGDTTEDGQQVVALIIAPGPAMNVQASAGCTARNQARSTPSPTMDARDYIECFDSTTLQFVSTASSTSFNDQVVRITAADIMPAIEAAIAKRIEREIVPALNSVFAAANWGFSGSNPVYPFAAPFANPGFNTGSGDNTGTSSFQGEYDATDPAKCPAVASRCRGLLPFNQTQGCTPATSNPRCTNTLMGWSSTGAVQSGGSGTLRYNDPCAWASADVFSCSGAYNAPSISLTLTTTVTNVAMGLRALDLSKVTCTAVDDVGAGLPTQPVACSVTGVALQSNGSAIVTVVTGLTPDIAASGWGTWALFKISFNRALIGDHSLLSSTDGTTGWFVRNEWYRLAYYAVTQSNTAARLPFERSCTTAADCLTVTNMTPSTSESALLIVAGRSINGTSRPSSTLSDYLESGNVTGAYVRNTVSASAAIPVAQRFNDRIVVVGSN